MKNVMTGLVCLCAAAAGAKPAPDPIKVTDVSLRGQIDGRNISFTLSLTVDVRRGGQTLPLIRGDVVLEKITGLRRGASVHLAPGQDSYWTRWPRKGRYEVQAIFAARPRTWSGPADGRRGKATGPAQPGWKQTQFTIPVARVRKLEMSSKRTDLEMRFPGALRVERVVQDGTLTATAILGPGHPFAVGWKPLVDVPDAKLVVASEANTIARISPGALRLDTRFLFSVAQGKMKQLSFALPENLSITQVRGRDIQFWKLEGTGADRVLHIRINRAQTVRYAVQVEAEMVLPEMPTELRIPVIRPLEGIRAGGFIALGTDSAIQMVVQSAGGLSQVEGAAFPRVLLEHGRPRPIPRGKGFFYAFASTPYELTVALDDIVPAYDASHRVVVRLGNDDLSLEAAIELDVRDAPVRSVTLEVDRRFMVSSLTGREVADHLVRDMEGDASRQEVEVQLKRPMLGRLLIGMRLELGSGPLGKVQTVRGPVVRGAKSERGYLVVAPERGVRLETPATESLREVHTGSVPMRVADAQYAYRFREPGWTIELNGRRTPPSVRVEAFHLLSLGEGMAYGSVVVNYFISGAPVDELHFRVSDKLKNVEFVGSDVQGRVRENDRWTVKLQRKITGDYNLGVVYSQPYSMRRSSDVLVGGVTCEGVDTQTGFLIVASHQNLKTGVVGAPSAALIAIDRDEVPSNYRLLVNAPVQAAFKYVNTPHEITLRVEPYARAAVLPTLVEMMDVRTGVSVRKNGETESLTRIRYKVKNTSSQFLDLDMPADVRAWSVHFITKDKNGRSFRSRIAASYDPDSGLLKIPLRRRRNPNEPTTVEIEYGQAHPALDWSGRIRIAAPRSPVRSTFAKWTVGVPEGWAIRPAPGGALARDPVFASGIGPVVRAAAACWLRGLKWWAESATARYLGLVVIGGVLLLFWFRREQVPPALAAVVLGAILLTGIQAALSPTFLIDTLGPERLRILQFDRVLNLDPEAHLTVDANILPAWRAHWSLTGLVFVPLIGLSALVAAVFVRRLRLLLIPAGLTLILAGFAQSRTVAYALLHLATWGAPAAFVTFALLRLLRAAGRRVRVLTPATAAVLLGALLFTGCVPKAPSAVERVTLELTAEKDSVAGRIELIVHARAPMQIPILDGGSILLSPEQISKHVRVRSENGAHHLEIDRAGRHEIRVEFVRPLAPADGEQRRFLAMSLPHAVSNSVTLSVPRTDIDLRAPTAVQFRTQEADGATGARAIFGPGAEVVFVWRPRSRETRREKPVFYAELAGLARVDTGVIETRHRARLRIARGELTEVKMKMPEGMTVIAVEGDALGAWRFDPASHELEARLNRPAVGEYTLTLVTQISSQEMPYTVSVGLPEILGAESQRSSLALATSSAVYMTIRNPFQVMNVGDFLRSAAELVAAAPDVKPGEIRHAYRTHGTDDALTVDVKEVLPESRIVENAVFTVADERLIYNGEMTVDITKAGVFAAEITLPKAFDIDSLTAPEVSHWDEEESGDTRVVQVHFRKKLLGRVTLRITLSRSESQLPDRIEVPRVTVTGARKHTGSLVVKPARGIQLSVAVREAVSERKAAQIGVRDRGALAFKLLKPEWRLALKTETIRSRVMVDTLHVVHVNEGLVRHTHSMRYRLHNAGTDVFEVRPPAGALGLLITGPDIAKKTPLGDGRWRVRLNQKWFGRPYPLTVRYETRFERSAGEFVVTPVVAEGADQQRGHLAVFTSERVELAAVEAPQTLQPAEARRIPRVFGAGDLSAAAFCYYGATPDYRIVFRATRHEAAKLLEAEVLQTRLMTVVSASGASITRVRMVLRVGEKRHLQTRLPASAQIWSLFVNRRPTLPSARTDEKGRRVLLIPLAHAATGPLPVEVEFVYVHPRGAKWMLGAQAYEGPRFDLPLKDLRWSLYLPDGYAYDDFEGTMTVNEKTLRNPVVRTYDIRDYESEIKHAKDADQARAKRLQQHGDLLARNGRQYEAKQALESAYNYSFANPALNEDTRVQLRKLIRQQAVVGLVGRRDHLRMQLDAPADANGNGRTRDLGDRFSRADAERLQGSLSKADSENLQLITRRMIDMQEAASGAAAQLRIHLALRGREIRFDRVLQVKPDAEMRISFAASRKPQPRGPSDWWWAGGLFAVLLLAQFAGMRAFRRHFADGADEDNGDLQEA